MRTTLREPLVIETRIIEAHDLRLIAMLLCELEISVRLPLAREGVMHHYDLVVILHNEIRLRHTPLVCFLETLRVKRILPILILEELVHRDRHPTLQIRHDAVRKRRLTRSRQTSD
jgi:hypothetical protein